MSIMCVTKRSFSQPCCLLAPRPAGVVYSGMGPDFRVLVRKGQKKAQSYYLRYGVRAPFRIMLFTRFEHIVAYAALSPRNMRRSCVAQENIPVLELVREIAAIMQEFTQSGGVRPFGVSLLIAGCVHPTSVALCAVGNLICSTRRLCTGCSILSDTGHTAPQTLVLFSSYYRYLLFSFSALQV